MATWVDVAFTGNEDINLYSFGSLFKWTAMAFIKDEKIPLVTDVKLGVIYDLNNKVGTYVALGGSAGGESWS